jgi:hypothetical protein
MYYSQHFRMNVAAFCMKILLSVFTVDKRCNFYYSTDILIQRSIRKRSGTLPVCRLEWPWMLEFV